MNLHEIEEMDFGRNGGLWDASPDVCCAYFQTGACAHTEFADPADWGFDPKDDAPLLTVPVAVPIRNLSNEPF